jgi:hypothetical protein
METAATGEEVGPESIEAVGEVVALPGEDEQAAAVALAVHGSGAVELLLGVEELERKDGEAVDDEAGGLRMERDAGRGGGQESEEVFVDLLDEVVAALVEAIDGTLGSDDGGVSGVGVTGLVLPMPEVEVGLVLLEDEAVQIGGGRGRGQIRVVAVGIGCLLLAEDGRGGEHLVEG